MNNKKFHDCPICSTPVPHWERYPRSVCRDCYSTACDEKGRKLSFSNISIGGGFQAYIKDTKEKHPSHICYIKAIKCWADEARFGGIVIQTYDEEKRDSVDI